MEKRSLGIYKILLDIAWYGIIIVMLMYFIGNIISLFAYREIRVGNITPFYIIVELRDFDFAQFKNNYSLILKDVPTLKLTLAKVELHKLTDPFILWYLFSSVVIYGVSIFQLKLFRSFIGDVINKKIFTSLNVKRLRSIGVVKLLTIPFGIAMYLIFSYFFTNHTILDSSLRYSPDYFNLFEELLPGLEYLIFAGVFSFGLKLKQEQDLTI